MTVFCLWQTFGTLIANAFVFILTEVKERGFQDWTGIPDDGIGLVIWCVFWIVLFMAGEESLRSETRC